jgi:uncharacterized glyoxalase superfamily metalloenzyme YdcJ
MKMEINTRFLVINKRNVGMNPEYGRQWEELTRRVKSIDSMSTADLLKLNDDMQKFSDSERGSRQKSQKMGGKTMRKNRIRIHR